MALDHSRLGLENKFLENKSGRIFCVRQVYNLLYKILPTSLGTCKPTFYTFYTSHLRWNSTMRCCFNRTDLGQNAVFHNFSIQIALPPRTHSRFRTIEACMCFYLKKFPKSSTYTASRFSLLTSAKVDCLKLQKRPLTNNKRKIIRWNIYRDNNFHLRRQVLKCLWKSLFMF